jgi:hypothetical protein
VPAPLHYSLSLSTWLGLTLKYAGTRTKQVQYPAERRAVLLVWHLSRQRQLSVELSRAPLLPVRLLHTSICSVPLPTAPALSVLALFWIRPSSIRFVGFCCMCPCKQNSPPVPRLADGVIQVPELLKWYLWVLKLGRMYYLGLWTLSMWSL